MNELMDKTTLFQIVKGRIGKMSGKECSFKCEFNFYGTCKLFSTPFDNNPLYNRYDICIRLFGLKVKQYLDPVKVLEKLNENKKTP